MEENRFAAQLRFHSRQRSNNRIRGMQLLARICGLQCNCLHCRSPRRGDAGRRIFKYQAVCGGEAKQGCPFQIWLGRWLAVNDVIGGDYVPGNRKTGVAKTSYSERTRG